jgi:hypothetical protein
VGAGLRSRGRVPCSRPVPRVRTRSTERARVPWFAWERCVVGICDRRSRLTMRRSCVRLRPARPELLTGSHARGVLRKRCVRSMLMPGRSRVEAQRRARTVAQRRLAATLEGPERLVPHPAIGPPSLLGGPTGSGRVSTTHGGGRVYCSRLRGPRASCRLRLDEAPWLTPRCTPVRAGTVLDPVDRGGADSGWFLGELFAAGAGPTSGS